MIVKKKKKDSTNIFIVHMKSIILTRTILKNFHAIEINFLLIFVGVLLLRPPIVEMLVIVIFYWQNLMQCGYYELLIIF